MRDIFILLLLTEESDEFISTFVESLGQNEEYREGERWKTETFRPIINSLSFIILSMITLWDRGDLSWQWLATWNVVVNCGMVPPELSTSCTELSGVRIEGHCNAI